jgi:hypothetical protein
MQIELQNSSLSPAGTCFSWHVLVSSPLIPSDMARGRRGVFGCPKSQMRFPPQKFTGKLLYCWYNANGKERSKVVGVASMTDADRKTSHVSTPNKPTGWGLTVAPDGRSILYVESAFEETNIMLVKNFR